MRTKLFDAVLTVSLLVATACVMSEEGSSLESVAHAVTEVDEGSVFAECDGNNQGCFDADCQGDDGDTDTSDPCWCTHCDNGNYCADYDEHQENDDDCTLTSS